MSDREFNGKKNFGSSNRNFGNGGGNNRGSFGNGANRGFKTNKGEFNPDIEVGKIYTGKVNKIIGSGAFVEFPESPKKDGFVHISQLANYRVEKVEDILKEGESYKFKLIGFDFSRKPKLSLKAVDQATGEDIENFKRKED
jgi:predicted RNA-binding protein with RPS1 domain